MSIIKWASHVYIQQLQYLGKTFAISSKYTQGLRNSNNAIIHNISTVYNRYNLNGRIYSLWLCSNGRSLQSKVGIQWNTRLPGS